MDTTDHFVFCFWDVKINSLSPLLGSSKGLNVNVLYLCEICIQTIYWFFIFWQQFLVSFWCQQGSSKMSTFLVHIPVYGGHLLYTIFRKKNLGPTFKRFWFFFFFNGNSAYFRCFSFECSNKPYFNFGRLTMVKSYERNINFTCLDKYLVLWKPLLKMYQLSRSRGCY